MKLEWRDQRNSNTRLRRDWIKELWAFGDPEPDGGVPYSYVGFVKRYTPTDKEPVWRVHVHELVEVPYWVAIEDMKFSSRSSAMREMRKRFNVAWVVATPEKRDIWDGFQ